MSSAEITNYLSTCRELLLRTERKGIDFDCSNSLDDEEYYNLTGISKIQFQTLCSSITSLRKNAPRYSLRTKLGLFLTKLRTGLSSNILKTLFGINRRSSISKIVKTVREALLKDFVPHYMGFDHITQTHHYICSGTSRIWKS